MTDEAGRTVDVDLVEGDVEAFDPYRVRWFLYEGGDGTLSMDDLRAACVRLADRGELRQVEESPRWFASPLGGSDSPS
jgi:hypothetical protein